jgi:hypothetical protein
LSNPSYAFATDRSINDVAQAVVDRELRFGQALDDRTTDEGSSGAVKYRYKRPRHAQSPRAANFWAHRMVP